MKNLFDRKTKQSPRNESLRSSDEEYNSPVTENNSSSSLSELKRSNERNATILTPSRRKSSGNEMKNSGNELKHSDDREQSRRTLSRRKSSHSDAESPGRKNIERKNTKDEKHPDTDSSVAVLKGLIQTESELSVKSMAIRDVSSSEHDDEPKKNYTLDLALIIAERTDVIYQRRAAMYSAPNFQRTLKSDELRLKRLPFWDTLKLMSEEITALERQKYEIIKCLVDILTPYYATELRTEKNHNKFCRDLLNILDFCMNVTEDSCVRSNFMVERKVTPKEKITAFWDFALYGLKLSPIATKEYESLLNQLVTTVDRGFSMTEKSMDLAHQKNYRSDKEDLSCVSWDFMKVIWDYNGFDATHLDQFKILYNENCFGLAGEFIYVPDMWEFIRHSLETEAKEHLSHHEIMLKMDGILKATRTFEEFQPEVKNSSFIGKFFSI